MRFCLVIAAVFAVTGPLAAADPFTVDWSRQFGTSGNERVIAVAADGQGGAYFTGYSHEHRQHSETTIGRFGSDGSLLWSSQFAVTSFGNSWGESLEVDAPGSLYLLGGYEPGDAYVRMFIRKYDPLGNMAWTAESELDGEVDFVDESANSLAVDAEGNVFVAGFVNHGGNYLRPFVSKFNTAGEWQWSNRSLPSEIGGIRRITVDSDGTASLFGIRKVSAYGEVEIVMGKMDSGGVSAGAIATGVVYDQIHDVFHASNGNAIVLGHIDEDIHPTRTTTVTAIGPDGSLLWTSEPLPLPYILVEGAALAVSANGYIFVSSYRDSDGVVMMLDQNGQLIGTHSMGSTSENYLNSISVDAVGSLFVGGYTNGDFAGPNAWIPPDYPNDAIIARLSVNVPEPSALWLTIAAIPMLLPRVR